MASVSRTVSSCVLLSSGEILTIGSLSDDDSDDNDNATKQ